MSNTETIITRKQRMNNECTHAEYYAQFVTEGTKKRVLAFIDLDRLIASRDEHLNDIPLKQWDQIGAVWPTTDRMKQAGDFLTMAGSVCINKEAARQIIKETIKAQYDENEDINDHAGNYVLLAEHFGDDTQKAIARRNLDYRDKHGHADYKLTQEAHAFINPLYYQHLAN